MTRPEWCGLCAPEGRLVQVTDDSLGRCPRCHPGAPANRAPRKPRRRRLGITSPTCPECGTPILRTHHCRKAYRPGAAS